MKLKLFLSSILVCLLSACGAEDESEPTFLEGSWLEQDCYDTNDALTEYGQSTFQYSGNKVTIYNHVYSTNDCSGDPILEARFDGSIALGEDKILSSGDTVTQYTITVNTATQTALTQAKADALSSDENCGINDWEKDVVKSVYECKFGSEPNVLKEIAKVDGDDLYRGDYESKDSTGYSTALDLNNPFSKQ